MRIFNRNTDEKDSLYAALRDMFSKGDEDSRFTACNFMHDPRISEKREIGFRKFIGPCSTGARFVDRKKEFVEKHVQRTDRPEFESIENEVNFVSVLSDPVVNVFTVNGLSYMFLWARELSEDELKRPEFKVVEEAALLFRTYPNTTNAYSDDSLDFVDTYMSDRIARETFIDAVRVLYEMYRKDHQYHPIWLTPLSDLEMCGNLPEVERANRWSERVGVSTERKDRQWIVLLKFGPDVLGSLYRPTVLDGASEIHFPTPEGSAAEDGGLAVDLRMENLERAREYISKWPSMLRAEADLAIGCGKLKIVQESPMIEIRRDHIQWLRRRFVGHSLAEAWLDRLGETEAAKAVV